MTYTFVGRGYLRSVKLFYFYFACPKEKVTKQKGTNLPLPKRYVQAGIKTIG